MSEQSIEKLMRDAYAPNLPYGFAERVALLAMTEQKVSLWDLLLGMTPKVGLAVGAFATILMLIGFTGEGPNPFAAISHYD